MAEKHLSPVWRFSLYFLMITCALAGLDGLLLVILPRLGLSFGQIIIPAVAWSSVRFILLLAMVVALHPAIQQRKKKGKRPFPILVTIFFLGTQLGLTAVLVDAFYIEPFMLGVTRLEVPRSQPVAAEAPNVSAEPASTSGEATGIRILHISDLHVEFTTQREERLLQMVEELRPDMIVLTGDYLNLSYLNDERSMQDVRTLLSQLHAPAGVYAVNGTVDSLAQMDIIFHDMDHITVLDNLSVRVNYNGIPIQIIGVRADQNDLGDTTLEALTANLPEDGFRLLLHHTPDLIESAAANGIDLYLAGHTHGGQVRLPFYGAVITFSRFGKQYEMGRYQAGETTLYVSRGVGMEGSLAPRMRFLCPPEIELIEIK